MGNAGPGPTLVKLLVKAHAVRDAWRHGAHNPEMLGHSGPAVPGGLPGTPADEQVDAARESVIVSGSVQL
jgi:hypothetical protein